MKNVKLKDKKLPATRHSLRGVTLVELMVVVALMAIIFIPLVQIFKSFTNAWWAGKARMTVQAEARDAMYWFTKDMKSAYRHSIGNLVRNGGFDSPDSSPTQAPTGWDWNPVTGELPAGIVKISSPSTRGFCIGVPGPTGVYSSTFTFTLYSGVDYILTARIANIKDAGNYSNGQVAVENLTGGFSKTTLAPPSTTNWVTVTVGGGGTFTIPSTDVCVVKLRNLGPAGTTAYFENISVAPKMAVLVGTGGSGEWRVPPDAGYPFVSEMQTETGYTKYLARYKIEVTTDSANVLRNRIWRQKAKSDMASFSNQSDWESIDYNHIAEYCDELKIGYDVPSTVLAQNGTDTGISMELVFRRASGGSAMQPYSMKTYIYPQSP